MSIPIHSFDEQPRVLESQAESTVEYFYSDGRTKFLCRHLRSGASPTDNTWDIVYYKWSGNTRKTQMLAGPVNAESVLDALSWTI